MEKRQTEYYMGAKLLEIGVEPKSAIYRWKGEDRGTFVEWTYTAYWENSKDQLLAEEAKAAEASPEEAEG